MLPVDPAHTRSQWAARQGGDDRGGRVTIGTEGAAVLLVEDDALLRRAISRALTEVHADVTAVATGAAALEAVGPGPASRL